jgi:ubiquinone/menaquinone biosynthesis C-methylase UbiE
MNGDRYTHGHDEPVLRSHRWRTVQNSAAYLTPHLAAAGSILDVGCGPGTLSVDLARHSDGGRVIAVDRSPEVIGAATEAISDEADLDIEFAVADVYALDFPDDQFDIVHAHQVLQHLTDPVAALVEMARVCRPGGLVAVRDVDYASMTWAPASDALRSWLSAYRAVAVANGAEPDAARHLRRWARAAAAGSPTLSASTWCFADTESCAWWSGLWADRVTNGALAEQFGELGIHADARETLAEGWRVWGADADAWFAMVHGELVIEVA